jgi:resuscitation-promoting factor RpfA
MHTSEVSGRATSFFLDWARENAAARPRPESPRPARRRRPTGRSLRRRPVAVAGVLIVAAATAALLPAASASADPSASVWNRLRVCESGNNYAIDTGNDHYGAYQFDLPTWRSVGGTGYPNQASKAEQDKRALILYRQRGWQPWQCASILGLREDSDAGSGRTGDLQFPTSTSSSSAGIPPFPGGSHWYQYGETSRNIKVFQDRMHARGYFPVGTGQYGANTRRMVEQLQRLNGLVPNGYIGPNTWRLAWTGTYRAP